VARPSSDNRRAKGVNLVGLVKLLKVLRRTKAIGPLSPAALALFEQHILLTEWYPLSLLLELVEVTYREVLGRKEEAALKMGITGGLDAFKTHHKAFIKAGDAAASVVSMRHTWPLYFDFGTLKALPDGPRAVRFVLEGYPGIPAAHGPMIVGWHRAAALAAGQSTVGGEILECPWRDGGPRLVHRVTF
jgi:hypothetical protein